MKSRYTFGHVVNHREPKGSRFVLDAVHEARNRGGDFGFIFAERLPYTDAEVIYQHIDILLEQFVIGWYGLQACEFALLGKPSIMWINEQDKCNIPDSLWNDIPFVNVHPSKLADQIMYFSTLPYDKITRLGEKCKQFIITHHSSTVIARSVIKELLLTGGLK